MMSRLANAGLHPARHPVRPEQHGDHSSATQPRRLGPPWRWPNIQASSALSWHSPLTWRISARARVY